MNNLWFFLNWKNNKNLKIGHDYTIFFLKKFNFKLNFS